jgi:thioesterase domain-containing protein/acyl carrier protein
VAEKGTYLAAPQEAQLTFGPQWQVLKEAALGEGEGLARLDLGNLSTNGSVLHPGLLDIATGWAMPLASTYSTDHLWVPVSYGAIRVHAALPQSIWSWVRSRADLPEGEARFDIVIADENGKVLVEIEDFAMQRLEQGFQPQRITASDLRTDDERATATQTAAEEQLAYLVSQGIRPAEGPLALRRALALGKPQVGISSMPLPALVAQADAPPTATKASSQSFERPELGSSFVAPEGDIEQKLAEIWENLLGVSPVGAADSFFDLGGHSLNAVRLFARIKQQFGVEYPISVLFDAPTIRDCAALIAADIGDSPNAGDAAQPEERYEFLVPLNDCKDPDATPLFIVAGMFGNVLNLRHLALPFSGERPVFGIQARGVIGHHEPHRRVAEAAHDYLLELRQRQPQGPYLIGGYSGGGVVAYEMAQQIRDQGEEVAVLALLDSLLPVRPMLSAADKALIKLQEFRRKGPTYALEWYRDRRDWKRMQAGQGDARDEPADDGFNNDKIADAFLEAMAHYEVPAWDGPVTLFRPPLEQHWQVTGGRWVSRNKEFVLPDNGWTRFAPRLEVIEVPGDHDSMVLAPNVTVLTQELREVIAQALDVPQDEWQEATAAQ